MGKLAERPTLAYILRQVLAKPPLLVGVAIVTYLLCTCLYHFLLGPPVEYGPYLNEYYK